MARRLDLPPHRRRNRHLPRCLHGPHRRRAAGRPFGEGRRPRRLDPRRPQPLRPPRRSRSHRRGTGAKIIGSTETARVMRERGIPAEQLVVSHGGEHHRLTPEITVRVFPSLHACTWILQLRSCHRRKPAIRPHRRRARHPSRTDAGDRRVRSLRHTGGRRDATAHHDLSRQHRSRRCARLLHRDAVRQHLLSRTPPAAGPAPSTS